MKVLSLFDGISCGRVALERAGIPVETYYASEIDKYAMSVAQAMYPDTIQIGDVCKIDFTQYIGKIDMIIGGSPCQDLSIAKQNRQGLQGERSRLFWEYIKALTIIKPKYFLLENVASMKNEDRDAITAVLRGIYPETECIMINSALVSAQQRKRYYWTNWHVEQPQDKGIVLKDILENSCSHQDKAHCLDANYYKGASLEHTLTKHKRTQVFEPVGCRIVGRKTDENGVRHDDWDIPSQQRVEINDNPQKANCISTVTKDSMVCESIELVPFVENKLRDIENKYGELPQMFNPYNKQKITDKAPTQTCQCASQTKSSTVIMFQPVRIGQLDGLGKGQANRIYSVRGKSVCLNANGGGGGAKTGLYKIDLPDGDYIVRKLTPRECARLQTYPERCFDVANISNTQWYKAFGNGWTVDVIAHIFKQIPTEN